MARMGDIIEHPVTGERIVFRQTAAETDGALLQAELTVRPHGFVAAEHVHPRQDERFVILAGAITLRLNGVDREVGAGEDVTVPSGTPHAWWNASDQEARVLVDLRPALRSEEFFETFFGLAQAGKVDKKTGLPNPFLIALIMREFAAELHLARPPLPVQKPLFAVLGSVGRLLGYAGRYAYPR